MHYQGMRFINVFTSAGCYVINSQHWTLIEIFCSLGKDYYCIQFGCGLKVVLERSGLPKGILEDVEGIPAMSCSNGVRNIY